MLFSAYSFGILLNLCHFTGYLCLSKGKCAQQAYILD